MQERGPVYKISCKSDDIVCSLSMAERLIARTAHVMHGDVVPRRGRWVRGVVGAGVIGTIWSSRVRSERLIGVRRFLDRDSAGVLVAVVVWRATRAAAGAD